MRNILLAAAICLLLTLPGMAIEPEDPGNGGGDPNACWECAEGTHQFPDGGTLDYSFCLALPDGGWDLCWEGTEGQGCILMFRCFWV